MQTILHFITLHAKVHKLTPIILLLIELVLIFIFISGFRLMITVAMYIVKVLCGIQMTKDNSRATEAVFGLYDILILISLVSHVATF